MSCKGIVAQERHALRVPVGCQNRRTLIAKVHVLIHFRLVSVCAILSGCFIHDSAFAQQNPLLAEVAPPLVIEDRLRLEIGAFGAGISSRLRVDPSPTVQGTEVSGEDDLALADFKVIPQLELTLLPGDRHLLRLNSLSLRRSAQTRLQRSIVFGDQTYLANERVDSTLNLEMFGLTYGYQFLKTSEYDLAATFGIQIAEIEANAVATSRVLREPETGVAPLPLLGIEGRAFFGQRWSVEGRVQYLSVNVSNVSGHMLDARLSGLWRFNPHLAAGLGLRYFDISVDSKSTSTPGLVSMQLSGPMLFMQASL